MKDLFVFLVIMENIILTVLILLYAMFAQDIKNIFRDCRRYNEIRKMHWSDSKYVVTKASNLSIGDETFSVTRLDEIVDKSIEEHNSKTFNPTFWEKVTLILK